MTLNVRGRHVGKDIFKPGERCQASGRYRCETCRNRGQENMVDVQANAIFPMCSQCDDWDMGWRQAAPAA